MALLHAPKEHPICKSGIMMGTMLLDWGVQYLDIKESNNTRRFVSGILGGYGAWTIYRIVCKRVLAGIIGE